MAKKKLSALKKKVETKARRPAKKKVTKKKKKKVVRKVRKRATPSPVAPKKGEEPVNPIDVKTGAEYDKFVSELIKFDFNASEAYRAIFGDEKSNRRTMAAGGKRLLNHPKVLSRLAEVIKARRRRMTVEEDMVIRGWAELETANVMDYFDMETTEDGLQSYMVPKNIAEMPEGKQKNIKKLKVKTRRIDRDEGPPIIEQDVEIEMYDRQRTLEMIAKHLGMLVDRAQVDVTVTDYAAILRERTAYVERKQRERVVSSQ